MQYSKNRENLEFLQNFTELKNNCCFSKYRMDNMYAGVQLLLSHQRIEAIIDSCTMRFTTKYTTKYEKQKNLMVKENAFPIFLEVRKTR